VAGSSERIVVIGAGMVAHRFAESLLSRVEHPLELVIVGEEGLAPYDRVRLTSFFDEGAEALALDPAQVQDDPRVRFVPGDPVRRIDRDEQQVLTVSDERIGYDRLVLATGSYAATLALDGFSLPGCFVYRTLDDVQRLRDFVAHRAAQLGRPLRGTVIGGGLLGLEAAGALQGLGVDATVVQSSERLMSV